MDKSPYDWSEFSLRIGIAADLKAIYNLCSSQEGLEYWFLSKAEFCNLNGKVKTADKRIEIGDTYNWEWHASDFLASGEVLGFEDQKSLSFTFIGCNVTVSVYKEMGETIVEIKQSNIPIDEASMVSHHMGCMQGWTFYLANLKSLLEGGIDLRNKNEGIANVINT